MEESEKNIMNNARNRIDCDGLSPKMVRYLISLERKEAKEELLDRFFKCGILNVNEYNRELEELSKN